MDKLSKTDIEDLALCAFRYALGRSTYITGVISDILSRYAEELHGATIELFIREIDEALSKDRAGQEADRVEWINLGYKLQGIRDANDTKPKG